VYNCESLEMLKHEEGFVVRELFKIKKNPNKNFFVITLCVSMFIACIGCVSYGVLP
jgi:hypothetical protein